MDRDNLEHGWIGSEDRGMVDPGPEKVGVCAWCGDYIYEDEECETHGYNEAGELLCRNCLEESKDRALS